MRIALLEGKEKRRVRLPYPAPEFMKEKRIALIAGSSRGIGKGIADYLLSKGYFVHVTYYKDKDLIEKHFKNVAQTQIHYLDVGSEKSVKRIVQEVGKTSKKLHLLVNNAVIDYKIPIESLSFEQWEETFAVKVHGTFLMTKYCLPLLKAVKRATIINTTSSWAHETQPEFLAAAAAEAAKMNFTKTCAVALAKYGVHTHSVNPGVTRTPL